MLILLLFNRRGSVIAVLENALDTRECGDTCESDFDNALVAMTGENNDLGGGAQPANPEIDVQEVDDGKIINRYAML